MILIEKLFYFPRDTAICRYIDFIYRAFQLQ